MKLYSYIIARDYGFAPNPHFEVCTLATCKPVIRRCAQVGDWIAAFGPASTRYANRLVVLMRVGETMTFDEYWEDGRFAIKRPVFNKGITHMYGDNIYHHDSKNRWMQEWSHHSMPDGKINRVNLEHDTATDRVLIADEFYYFGSNAVPIPEKFNCLLHHGRAHRVCRDEEIVEKFVKYIKKNYDKGMQGTPFSRKIGKFAHYRGKN